MRREAAVHPEVVPDYLNHDSTRSKATRTVAVRLPVIWIVTRSWSASEMVMIAPCRTACRKPFSSLNTTKGPNRSPESSSFMAAAAAGRHCPKAERAVIVPERPAGRCKVRPHQGRAEPERRRLKDATRSTSVYLLPQDLKRVRLLAIDHDISMHEYILQGLDRMLADDCQEPVERHGAAEAGLRRRE